MIYHISLTSQAKFIPQSRKIRKLVENNLSSQRKFLHIRRWFRRAVSLNQSRMAQSIPPGDIVTQPGTKIVFNAPYDDKHTYHIKVSTGLL
jgi:hypothetical protein